MIDHTSFKRIESTRLDYKLISELQTHSFTIIEAIKLQFKK